MMLIDVRDIDRRIGEKVSFSFSASAEDIGAVHDDYSFVGEISAKGIVENAGGSYRLEGIAICTKLFNCDRCLEQSSKLQEHAFSEEFVRPDDISAVEQVGDAVFFEGDNIDIAPLVRDTLLSGQSLSNVCCEGCKGLCIKCGANLNKGDCGCDRFVPDPRLAALKDFFR